MLMAICALLVVAPPAALALNMGLSLLLGYRPSERRLALSTQATVVLSSVAAATLLINMLLTDQVQYTLDIGRWVDLPVEHFHFTVKFLFDRLSIPFVILSLLLCGVISAFALPIFKRIVGFYKET